MIIRRNNEERENENLPPIAFGPMDREYENICSLRHHFLGGGYLSFVLNFNLKNRFTVVAHSAYYHNDTFHKNSQSLENKILLVDYSRNGTNSRGGSTFGNFFTYALLDWGYDSATQKQWFRSNATKHGLDPNVRVTKKVRDPLSLNALADMMSYRPH